MQQHVMMDEADEEEALMWTKAAWGHKTEEQSVAL